MPWNIDSVTCRNFINQISQNKQTKKLHAKFSYLYNVDIKFNWDHNQQHHTKQYNTGYHLDSWHNISLMNHMIHMAWYTQCIFSIALYIHVHHINKSIWKLL